MKRLSPMKSIRKYCLDCCVGSSKEVRFCVIPACPLFPFRFGKRVKRISPLKMIRKNCLDCGEGTPFDVKNCEITDCYLYQYRFGKNPFTKRKGNISNLIPFARKNSVLSTQETPRTGIGEMVANEFLRKQKA